MNAANSLSRQQLDALENSDRAGLGLTGAEFTSEITISAADYQALLDKLAQVQERDQERQTRIHHLEQALDQALTCLDELRLQVQHQQVLEIQLADTENYASVQQQAIVRLKLQLADQQQALEAQVLETQQRDQAIQELLATIEGMTQAQHREVERLRSRLAQDQFEVQTHRSRLDKYLHDLQAALESRQHRVTELESETLASRTLATRLQNQLETAHQQIKELSGRLSQHQFQLVQLETQLEQSQPKRQMAGSEAESSGRRSGNHAQSGLAEIAENRLTQLAHQARWQQQDLEAERTQLHHRVVELEQQVAEMQEQILRQAKQETEYETAVQYWKDQQTLSQQRLNQVKQMTRQWLKQSASEANPCLTDLLDILQIQHPDQPLDQSASGPSKAEGSEVAQPIPPLPLPLPRLTTVELPEFLVRRRAAQKAQVTESLPNSLA